MNRYPVWRSILSFFICSWLIVIDVYIFSLFKLQLLLSKRIEYMQKPTRRIMQPLLISYPLQDGNLGIACFLSF